MQDIHVFIRAIKNIFLTICVFYLNGYSQNPVLDKHTNRLGQVENAYYKDIEGFYNQFVGTWVYADATQTIRFKFKKRERIYTEDFSKPCYVDYLVGEAQYIKSGLIVLNSLNNLDSNHQDIDKYSIFSFGKIGYHWYPRCEECPLDVERLFMSYDEATNDDFGLERNLIMRRVIESGVQKLKIQFIFVSSRADMNKDNPDTPSTTQDFTIPFGNYTLTKEP